MNIDVRFAPRTRDVLRWSLVTLLCYEWFLRFKVETQLLSWLQKYDLEIGDKQIELDELTEQYEDEIKKCEELEVKKDTIYNGPKMY